MRMLMVVEDVFDLGGRGLVIFPRFVPVDEERFHSGDQLLLICPDGAERNTAIAGIEAGVPNPNGEVVVLLKDIAAAEIPPGTQVWSTTPD